jgi:hypothetical protein
MSTDYGEKYETTRDKILRLLSDLEWHSWKELRAVGGVRYGARVRELLRLGYRLKTADRDDHGKNYCLEALEPSLPAGKQVKIYMDERDVEVLVSGFVTTGAKSAAEDALESFRFNRNKL